MLGTSLENPIILAVGAQTRTKGSSDEEKKDVSQLGAIASQVTLIPQVGTPAGQPDLW